jgi:recombination DNA repair RAD52 pathway protein
MTKRFHVVGISKGYHRLASYETMAEAVTDILGRSLRSMGCVLRDGTTGKRYCVNECRALADSRHGDVSEER